MAHTYRYDLTIYEDGVIAYQIEGVAGTIGGLKGDLENVVEDAINDLETSDADIVSAP